MHSLRRVLPVSAATLLVALALAGPPALWADEPEPGPNPGQAELDAAIDAKLGARGLADYERVIDHCKKALELGLDEESRKFAEDLHTGTLVDRAAMLVEAIYNAMEPDPQWPRMRAFAMRDLEEIIVRDPKLGQAWLLIARLESLPRGNRQRAREAAFKAIDLLGEDGLQTARAYLVLATLEDDAAARAAHYDKAVQLAPRDADIRRARGMALLVQEKFDDARADLLTAIEEDPEDATLRQALGLACMMSERLDEARAAFDKAIELAPDTSGPYLQRARLEAVAGEHEKALADIDRALQNSPGEIAALILRARVNQQAGNDAEAVEDVDRILENDPRNEQALELRGLLAADRGDYAAAIRDFRRLVAAHPDDAVLMSQLGMLYLAARQPREAVKRFTRALEIDEKHFSSLRGRSDALISIGEHEKAVADLDRAHALRPDDTGVLNNLAWLLATSPEEGLRDGARAVELAKKACEATEWKESHIVSTLAAGYAEQGDFETARRYSKQAVEAADVADEVREQLAGELASYENKKPWRERQEMEEATLESPAFDFRGDDDEAEDAEPAIPAVPRRPFDDD
jgi:tetratricopeptide (TPR) repeat protein